LNRFLFLPILLPLIAVLLIAVMPLRLKKYVKYSAIAVFSLNILILIMASQNILKGNILTSEIAFMQVSILIDKLGLFVSTLITSLAILVSVSDIPFLENTTNFKFNSINLLLFYTGAILITTSGNIICFAIGFIIITSAIYASLIINPGMRAIETGFRYLSIGLISVILVLTGLILIYKNTGSLNFIKLANLLSSLSLKVKIFSFTLILSGIFIQSGYFPFGVISEEIHSNMPDMLIKLMPTVIITYQFYLIIRFSLSIFDFKKFLPYLMIISIPTIIFNEIHAFFEKDRKKMLIYSSYGASGLCLFAFSIPSVEAVSSGFLILMNTVITLTTLFLANNLLLDGNKTKSGRKNPYWKILLLFSLLPIISLIGFPPLIGFFAKFNLLFSAIAESYAKAVIFAIFIILIIITQGIYLLRCFGRLLKTHTRNIKGIWYTMGTIIALGIAIILLSFFSTSIVGFSRNISLQFIQGLKSMTLPSTPGGIP
jgi:formate hydrogenlyase subunit 3/multisubunit Na+/H+ antiporter MnhD subunit